MENIPPPITTQILQTLAESFLAHWLAAERSIEQERLGWVSDWVYNLTYDESPEYLWAFIEAVHALQGSEKISPVFAAGPIEDLLARYGDLFIERIETKAKQDPTFARVLGGVWKNTMSNENWARLQAVWDRRGWDGIPE